MATLVPTAAPAPFIPAAPAQPKRDETEIVLADHTTCGAKCFPTDSCLLISLPARALGIALAYLSPDMRRDLADECSLGRPIVLRIENGWDPKECTAAAISALLIEKMQALVEDYAHRKAAYKTNLRVLGQGFWYPNDYFLALKELNQNQRLTFLRDRNDFLRGLPPHGFDRVLDPQSPMGVKIVSYILKRGVEASAALGNVKKTLCFLDCQATIGVAYYETLLEIFGERRFNHRYRADGPSPLYLDPNFSAKALRDFLQVVRCEKGKTGNRPVKKGEVAHFKNVPVYQIKHFHGEAGAFNVVCVQDQPQKFIGFGLPPKGVTEPELFDVLAGEFNRDPIEERALIPDHLYKALSSEDSDLTNNIDGIPKEVVKKHAAALKMSRDTLIETERTHPEAVGFASYAVQLRPDAIQKALAE